MWASQERHKKVVECLVEKGAATVNIQNKVRVYFYLLCIDLV